MSYDLEACVNMHTVTPVNVLGLFSVSDESCLILDNLEIGYAGKWFQQQNSINQCGYSAK